MYIQASCFQSNNQFVINLCVDSRMVHMRNLAYFFCPEKTKGKKYLCYTDFILRRLSNEISGELFDEIQRITSNATCHLLKGRFSESFKNETAVFEQTVFPIFVNLIKDFITMEKDNVCPKYLAHWRNNIIQENMYYLIQLISSLEIEGNTPIVTGTTGNA